MNFAKKLKLIKRRLIEKLGVIAFIKTINITANFQTSRNITFSLKAKLTTNTLFLKMTGITVLLAALKPLPNQ
jgi:hypothetical protein